MLTPQLRSQFVTKFLTSPTGEKFKVVFLVALVNGEVKAQVVSAIPVQEAPLFLPVIKNNEKFVNFSKSPTSKVLSPFFNQFFFYNSQPTRAPAL
jgi:hypothetical protein